MALTYIYYTGDGTTNEFLVPFDYIKKDYVKFYIDEQEVDSGEVTWDSDTQVSFAVPPSNGSKILIKRETEIEEPLVDFRDGSTLTEDELDMETAQLLHLIQEGTDNATGATKVLTQTLPWLVDSVDDIKADSEDGFYHIGSYPNPETARYDASGYPVTATGSTVARTLQERFADVVNVKDYGAVGDGVTDDTDAFCAAVVGHNAIYVPSGTYALQFTSSNASSLPAVLSGVYGPGKLNVTVAEGVYSLDSTIDMSGGEISSLTLNGSISEEVNATAASVSSSTFSVVHWDGITKNLNYSLVTFTLDSVPEGTAAGMFATVYNATGDVRFNGCWEITAVSGSTITVLVMSNSAPANFMSAKLKIIKTVLKFLDLDANPAGVVGLRLGNASEVALDNVVFVGAGRPVASEDGRGPTRYDSPGGAGPNGTSGVTGIDAEKCGILELGSFFAISGFSGTNISIGSSGGIFNGFSCGAGRNGIGIAFTAGTQCLGSTCAGNLIDGYVIQDNSSVLAKNALSIGNYRHGFIATMGSEINSSNCTADFNGGDGLSATGCAVNFTNGTSLLNSQYGIHATNGAIISCRDIACRGNTLGGVYAISSSSVFVSTTNNADIDCSNNSNFDFKNDTNGFIYCPKKKSTAVTSLISKFYTKGGTIAALLNENNKLLLGTGTEFSGTGPSGARLMVYGGGAFRGGIFPETGNSYNLGNADYRWATVYVGTGNINTSDEREKTNITDLSDATMRAWGKVNFKVFQFIDAVKEKGENARLHTGLVAQDIARAFESEGLDASRYGLFCYDEWDAETDVDGNEISSAGNRYGIRYEEALALECAYQRWLGEQRDRRIAELESKLKELTDSI